MMPLPEHVHMALETSALTESELRERVASLEADVVGYREVAQQAIHSLHHVTRERDRLRTRVRELLDGQREAA